jgi:hypothetical protein
MLLLKNEKRILKGNSHTENRRLEIRHLDRKILIVNILRSKYFKHKFKV